MLVQKPRTPYTRKHPDPIVPGDRPSLSDPSPSPTSPLERNPLSPKGWKNRDSGAVGLGIVAALEKAAMVSPKLHVSPPIAIAIASRRAARPSGWPEDSVAAACTTPAFQTADFLSHCNLCRKRLHGKDIYMYRGEKAFCSIECRYRQIVSDEFQEKCGSEASKQSEISSSPYSGGGRLFFTGIVAA